MITGDLQEYKMTALASLSCPAELIPQLLEDQWDYVKTMAGQQKCLDEKALGLLSKHPDPAVRRGVAYNPLTPISVLERLAMDEDDTVRRASLQQGRRMSQSVLVQLASDDAPHISRLATRYVDVNSDDFAQIVQSKDPRPRSAAAKRPDCPPHILEQLASDLNADVRSSVASNQATPAHILSVMATDQSAGVRLSLADNPSCPPIAHERLARDNMETVRRAVASHARCPEQVQQQLAQDEHWLVRLALACNPNCSTHTVHTLLMDADPRVRRWALAHPNCPEEYKSLRQVMG
jgi:hypothetical protein